MGHSYQVLGASRLLRSAAAADAVTLLRKGLKQQIWDRSSQFGYWVWYVSEKLPSLKYYHSEGLNDNVSIELMTPLNYIWPHPSLEKLFALYSKEIGIHYQLGFNVDPRSKKKVRGVYDIALQLGRINSVDKVHYFTGLSIYHQDAAFCIRWIKEMLRMAGYSDKALTVQLSDDGNNDTYSLAHEIPVATHPSAEIPLDIPIASDGKRLDGFTFGNLSFTTAFNWFENLRERMSAYRLCEPSLEITIMGRAWDDVRNDLERLFPGPWKLDYFCRAREHHGPETLKEITEVGAFVPLDVMGLKGSGLIYCDALRHEEGWELWFHHDSGGSSAKLAMFRDRIAELSGLPDLFDRPQEFACGGNLDPT